MKKPLASNLTSETLHSYAGIESTETQEDLHNPNQLFWSAETDGTRAWRAPEAISNPNKPEATLPAEWEQRIHPEDHNRVIACYQKAVSEWKSFVMDYRIQISGQNYRWVRDSGLARFDSQNSFAGFSGCSTDIDDLITTRDLALEVQRYRGILLSETHHRVKNNMQTLDALLAMASEKARENSVETTLEDARTKVQGMMRLYELLFQGDMEGQLSLADYIQDIVMHIRQYVLLRPEDINIQTNLEDCNIPSRQAYTIGLLINELVGNAIKHAFPDKGKGNIHISLHIKDDLAELRVSDDGTGQIDGSQTTPGFGHSLVDLLTNQLKAISEGPNGPGTVWTFTIPLGSEREPFRKSV